MEAYSPDLLWMVILGFIIAFVLSFGIGANDVANSFGTSVGSGVLTIRQACILATICEISGAVLIGYKVSDTMRKGILEVGLYEGSEPELMLGCVAALASSAIWLLVATFLKLPISGTHSIVGSTIGFSLVARGTQGLQWYTLLTIVGSWFISPVLSGCMSILLFFGIRKFIIRANDPLKAGFNSLPIFYGITLFINVISVVLDGPKLLYMDNIPIWIAILASLAFGLFVAVVTQIVIVPIQKRQIAKKLRGINPVNFNFEDSVESSPSGSPKKNRRPLSLASDGKLPAIAEITELVSLTDTNSPKTFKLAPNGYSKSNSNENYKINPEIIRKAEDLLGKTSLDNTDLTITSLNFIDEQHLNGNGNLNGTNLNANGKGSNLEDAFKQLYNEHQTISPMVDGKSNENSNALPKSLDKNNRVANNSSLAVENITEAADVAKNDFKVVESGTSLEMMISSTLLPNSSKVSLIESKETNRDGNNRTVHQTDEETEEVSMLFSFLQILTATFGSFAHGGNDVSNAIGPLIALYMIYKEGSVLQKAESPIAILVYGGIGISIGLWLWGRRVIETIGSDLTKITASTGFTIEVGAAVTVLLASKIGLPISTTHCKVGSVVFVGYVSSRGKHASANAGEVKQKSMLTNSKEMTAEGDTNGTAGGNETGVDWHLFRNIAYAWIVTVPVTALLSAAIMFLLCSMV